MASFEHLPAELLHSIPELLERVPDLYAFVRINRRCYSSAHDRLWRIGAADALEDGTREGNMETVQKAIHFGADNFGHALELAVDHGQESIAKLMLHHYPGDRRINALYGYKALDAAIDLEFTPLLWPLINSGKVNLDRTDVFGRTLLSIAADVEWGEVGPTAQELENLAARLAQSEADLDLEDLEGRTPLSYAVERNNAAMISMLLSTKRVDVNSADNRKQRTPLFFATQVGWEEPIETLVRVPGIAVDRRDFEGWTPLLYAVRFYREPSATKVVRLLLRAGADVNQQNDEGTSPFLCAVEHNATEWIDEMLISGRVDVGQEWLHKNLPFFYFARRSDVYHVHRLLDAGGVDPKARDKMNRTALSHAAECNNVDVVRILLKDGRFDTDKWDNRGRTPLSYAVECGTEDVVDMLLRTNRVKVDLRDSQGRTPLSYAAGRGGRANDCTPLGRYKLTPQERTFEYLLGLAIMKKLRQASPGLDLWSRDDEGWRPLDYAIDSSWDGREEKVEFLKLIMGGASSGAATDDEDTTMSDAETESSGSYMTDN